MENRAYAVAAVAFIAVLLAAGAFVYYWLTVPPAENRIYRVVSPYEVGQLRGSSEVAYKGLVVGHVKSVGFHPEDPDKVLVRIGIQPGVPITESMYAQVMTQGLTGSSYLALKKKPGSSDKPLRTSRRDPARIPMHKGLLQQVMGSAEEITSQVETLTSRLNQLVARDNRKQVNRILGSTVRATARMQTVMKRLQPTINVLHEVLRSSDRTVSEARRTLQRMQRLADTTAKQARKAGQAATDLQDFAESGEQVLQEGDRQLLPDLEDLAEQLQRTAQSLETLSQQLESQPSSLLYGPAPRPPGPGEPGFRNGEQENGEAPRIRPRQ
ncbi:MlaD family protein [Thiohalorhabdus sp. Cl-TMA]|uniref:MlaD family protein n=1 Tax=Thiohalorhabdus methylotrophus TaxID=3242694 RepID=A0ABV4TXU6_9GAMM